MSNEPDFNPEDETSVLRTLDREFTRPPAFFQGKPLWPFTPGSKALYHMALSDEDTRLYRVLAFILIHIRGEVDVLDRNGDIAMRHPAISMEADLAARIVPLVWNNLGLFRMKALSLCDTATPEDIAAAFEIVEKELKLEAATEISATPPDYGPQKKSEATSRPKPAGKRSRRQKNST